MRGGKAKFSIREGRARRWEKSQKPYTQNRRDGAAKFVSGFIVRASPQARSVEIANDGAILEYAKV